MTTTASLSRRSLFRGRLHDNAAFRPPWSPDEDSFIDQCRRCGDCISACETGLLVKGSGGFPEADFNNAGCTFCGKCSQACTFNVLNSNQQTAWNLEARINESCLAVNKVHCRTCQEQCEPEAISFRLSAGGIAKPIIDSSICTGCGECVSGCPVDAINMHRKPSNK